MSQSGSEPIRRNLLLVSTIFIIYFVAGGELKGSVNTGIVPIDLQREWILGLAAWIWFGYAYIRYDLAYKNLDKNFKTICEKENALDKLLIASVHKYQSSRHCKKALPKCRFVAGSPSVKLLLIQEGDLEHTEITDAVTGKQVKPTSLRLLGRWVLEFRYSDADSGEAVTTHAAVSFLNAPFWRLHVIWKLLTTQHLFTERYMPIAYAHVAFYVAASFLLVDGLSYLASGPLVDALMQGWSFLRNAIQLLVS